MPKLILNGKEYASGIPSNSNFIEETLWTNNDGSGVGTYSLSQNIDNYDFIAIYYGVYSDWTTASNPSGNCTIYSVKDLKNFYNNGKGMIIPGYGNRFVFFDLYDSELKIRIVNDNQTILIVRGIKLAGGVQLANVYSTTEHIIGTWIDGKPLYEKTFEVDVQTDGNVWVDTGVVISDIKNIIKYDLIGIDRYVGNVPANIPGYVRYYNNNFQVYVNLTWNITFKSIILQYTKTTD